MAWSDPVHLNTNDLVTEAHWNVHRDDLLVLRTGGLAISSQDTGTIPYASSPTQLAMSANLAFDGSSLVVSGAADNTGLIVSATLTNRPMLKFQNATTMLLAAIQGTDDKGLNLYANGSSLLVARLQPNGGFTIGGTTTLGAGCLGVEGGAIYIPDSLSTDSIHILSGAGLNAINMSGLASSIHLFGSLKGAGAVTGQWVSIGHNASGSGASGHLAIYDRVSVGNFIWPDVTGVIRTGPLPPTEDDSVSDTSGAPIGGQVSWHALKTNIRRSAVTPHAALDEVLKADIYDFEYPGGGYQDADGRSAQFTGLVGYDRSADWFLKNVGPQQIPVLNDITLFGYLVLSLKALAARVAALEAA